MSYAIGTQFLCKKIIPFNQVVLIIRIKMGFRDTNVFESHFGLICHCLAFVKHSDPSIRLLLLIKKFSTWQLYCRCGLVYSFSSPGKKMPQKFRINVSTFTSIDVMMLQQFTFYQRNKHVAFYEFINFSDKLVILTTDL